MKSILQNLIGAYETIIKKAGTHTQAQESDIPLQRIQKLVSASGLNEQDLIQILISLFGQLEVINKNLE